MPLQFSCVPLRSTSENCAVLPCFSDFGCFPTAHFLTFPPSAFGRWSYFWCGHGDSNPNAVKHENLNLACLPISSCPHSDAILPQPRAGSKQKIAVRFLKAAETRKRRIFYFVLRLHNERETHGANPVSPAFLIRFRRAAAPPSGAAFFRRTSASRCRTRRGWSGAASE